MAITTVPVHGTLKDVDGTPLVGATLTFTLSTPITDGVSLVSPIPVTATTDVTGAFTQSLYANNDTTTTPTGTYYTVAIKAASSPWTYSFSVIVPAADSGGIDLFVLATLSNPNPPAAPYVSQIVAGSGITLSPTNGEGQVTITSAGGGLPGVTVSGSASAGKVLTATSSSAATWSLPAPSAAEVTFDPSAAENTTSTDVQDALIDIDGALTSAANSIPDVSGISTQAANSHGDLFQNLDGSWPANPADGRLYTWHGSGQWIGPWVAGAHVTGDGVYVTGTGVFTAKTGFTDTTFTSSQWNQVPMNTDDDLKLR